MRSGDSVVTLAADCQGPAAWASMDKKTPKKIDTQKVGGGGGDGTTKLSHSITVQISFGAFNAFVKIFFDAFGA